jgi:peptidoglycan/LPS O-acetylase OafA/YrhL
MGVDRNLEQAAPDGHRPGPRRQRRGDIQGLRAVAVLLVMLDHAGIPGLEGGYLGVDVFFVISGFLITGILVREVRRTGRVSIASFYARRARRILPAASVVLVAIVVVSSQLYGYLRINEVMTHVTWATFFAANIHSSLAGSNYFDATSFVSPVQHFWSLAVEEQFYLIWPPLIALVLFTRRKAGSHPRSDSSPTARPLRVLSITIAGLCLLSLAWSVWRTGVDPSATYYSTPARAWELGAGALLALGTTWVCRLPTWVTFAASWIGLAAVATAAATYSAATPFPGYHALLPVLGTVLILAGGIEGHRYGASVVLDRLPLRWIGDISYSLYLWHWPILVLPVVYLERDLQMRERVALMVGAIAVSALSYWFVEGPVQRAGLLSRHRLTALAMWPASVAVLVAAVIVVQQQYGQRPATAAAVVPFAAAPAVTPGQPPAKKKKASSVVDAVRAAAGQARAGAPLPAAMSPSLGDLWGDLPGPPQRCVATRDATKHEICALGDTGANRTIVLFGDSHMGMWIGPLLQAAEADGWKIVPLMKFSCIPVNVTEWRSEEARPFTECDTWREWAYGEIARIKPDRIILSGHLGVPLGDVDSGRPLPEKETGAVFADGAKSALKRLRPLSPRVDVISGTPTLDREPRDCLSGRRATMASCAAPLDPLVEERNRAWKKAAAATGAHWIDVVPWLCDKGTCPLVVGNLIVYRDGSHLTRTYVAALGDLLLQRLGL